MKKVLILDGNSLAFRAFYALPLLTTSEGKYTNALYGFTNMLFKMKEEINPDYIFAAFDRKALTFRHLEYKDYKAGRKKMPSELAEQFPRIKQMLSIMNIKIYEIEGYEADDIIGTIADKCGASGMEVYVVTGDRDALQLASDNINVVITKKGVSETESYTKERMMEEFKVTPQQFIDVKGLMGDKSDNIPGVPGVGEKTAFKLIAEYGSIENVLKNIDKISGKKLKENLEAFKEQAVHSKHLATIVKDVPIEFNIEDIKVSEADAKELKKFIIQYQMKSLLNKLPECGEDTEEIKTDINYEKIDSNEKLKSFVDSIKDISFISYELKGTERFSTKVIDNLYVLTGGKSYVIEYSKIENEVESLDLLKKYFEKDEIKKVVHDCKNLITVLSKMNIEVKGMIFDTAISAYLLDSAKQNYSLPKLVNDYLCEDIDEVDSDIKIIENSFMSRLYETLKSKIEEQQMEKLLYEVEMPLCFVLSAMESAGFNVNRNKLDELEVKFREEIDKTQRIIYELCDEEFNINSPKQLGKILFEKLDLPIIKKTKTGYSTNAEVLEKLADKHPVIEKIIYFRQITKIYSTYVEGLKQVIDKDGKIHSSFNQTVTTTGRLSSTDPNLQNIPIKYEMGREIRKVFIPNNEDDIILSADYSQIELRVLAHMAGDENMINAFTHHTDIHTKTASEVFNVPIEEVTSLLRSRAKAVNFGIVYGISDFSLSQDLHITRKEAKQYMDAYFERYPKVKEYLDKTIVDAKKDGYALTILNRKRYIPEISASNKIVKALGERLAMNAPIQGSAADIIKLAMVHVYNELKKNKFKSEIILQVHDELILNVKQNEFEQVKLLVKTEMENALKLHVGLDVDINTGNTWYEAK
ncbi:MAG: DNA polymerase I [Inconstantimicrobium porci]|uniref:DNA polymerase I n=1 Tax=Inconstantimicrobium porci TaxID=2652291 RepID=UPI002A910FF0|nr:DNA polymerase I [Inconstantimicrobium porci]MDY5912791.1 DNA polymerase I [Inconstantimicrobium porci]